MTCCFPLLNNLPVKFISPLTSNSYSVLVDLPIPTFPLVRRLVSVPTVVNEEPVTPLPNDDADNTSLLAILYTLLADKSTFSLNCQVLSDEL